MLFRLIARYAKTEFLILDELAHVWAPVPPAAPPAQKILGSTVTGAPLATPWRSKPNSFYYLLDPDG